DAYRLSAHEYHLAENLPAPRPVDPPQAPRLPVVGRGGPHGPARAELRLALGRVRDLPPWPRPRAVPLDRDHTVLAHARGGRSRGPGGRAEFWLLRPVDGASGGWPALARPARRLRPGPLGDLPGTVVPEVVGEEPDGVRRVRLRVTDGAREAGALQEALARAG